MSNKPQLNQKNSIYHKPIGKLFDQYYFLNYSDEFLTSGFSLELYDNELGFIKDRFIQNEKKNSIIKLFTSDSSIYWFSIFKKKKNIYQLKLNKLDMDLDSSILTWNLDEIQIKDFSLNQTFFDYSPNRQVWSFSYCSEGSENNTIFNTIVGNCAGLKLSNSKIEIPIKKYQLLFENSIITDSENVVSLIRSIVPNEFFSKGRAVNYYLIETGKANAAFFKLETKESILNIELAYNRKNSNFKVLGLNGDYTTGDIKGYFGFDIPENSLKPINDFEIVFNETTLKQILGIKKNKRIVYPRNLFIRKIIFESDHRCVLISEEYSETRQLETYYVNGIPQTSTKILYHFGDIVSFLIDEVGNLDTFVVIQKDQSSTINNLYFMGFATYTCKDGIHFIYNNDISRGNEIVDIQFNPQAKIQKKSFFNGDQLTNIIIPYDGKEIEYCSFTVPLYRDKQWFWMKIFNDD